MRIENLEIGDRIKTKLSFDGKIVCSMRDTEVEFYQLWIIKEIRNNYYIVSNKRNEIASFDFNGNGLEEYSDHIVYKIKRK